MLEFVLPSLDANISRFTDPFSMILGSLESPCSGLYRRKKSSPIESLDPEIFTLKLRYELFNMLKYCLNANILGSTDLFFINLGSLESP